MMTSQVVCRIVILALVLCALPLDVAAQEGTGPLTATSTLEGIVVTPSRSARDVQSTPNTVYRLGASEIVSREGARTTPDMLEQTMARHVGRRQRVCANG